VELEHLVLMTLGFQPPVEGGPGAGIHSASLPHGPIETARAGRDQQRATGGDCAIIVTARGWSVLSVRLPAAAFFRASGVREQPFVVEQRHRRSRTGNISA